MLLDGGIGVVERDGNDRPVQQAVGRRGERDAAVAAGVQALHLRGEDVRGDREEAGPMLIDGVVQERQAPGRAKQGH